MPYGHSGWVVEFPASRELLQVLGEPGFIEDDPTRTAGGRELFWAFEMEGGLRLVLLWGESMEYASVSADPPEPERVIEALRALGLNAPFQKRQLPAEEQLPALQARGAVWVFTGRGASEPAAVFSRKQLADAWLARNRFSGTLVAHPLDISQYDLERRLRPSMVPEIEREEAQRYVGVLGERYEYVEGSQVKAGGADA
ncbi:DUF7710 domain-containing protein [Pyxidicoccus caerfyrddinensis]|uniref:DUF7710 domain-containing protein n=1 Tax=Pyxidicoccus caerfyrddinensis TaxID=2709663 RepID=UPI001F085403|nr:hypothetical protein [Pyxidicoccus caerfyrddinensis]